MFRQSTQYGFTLIELMIGLALTTVIIFGAGSIYVSGKRNYATVENLSRVQEDARFALMALIRDVRLAGYTPCGTTTDQFNQLAAPLLPWWNFFAQPITGADNAILNSVVGTNNIGNSDSILVVYGEDNLHEVNPNATNATQVTLNAIPNNLAVGDVVLMCDKDTTTIFQIGAVNGLELTPTIPLQGTFANAVQLIKLNAVAYVLAAAPGDVNTSSLYRIENNGAAGITTTELLHSAETLQILYGVNTDADKVANRYFTATGVGAANWNNVISVQIGLLMATEDNVTLEDDARPYTILDQEFDSAGSAVEFSALSANQHRGGRRLRYVVSSTVNLRNSSL